MISNNKSLKVQLNFWFIITVGGCILFLAVTATFFFLGRLNSDEGWYLYASKLVYSGEIPYKDFAYTQMPLLPYIYGLPQLVLPSSIYVGRLTSLFISLCNFVVSVKVANKYGGAAAGGITALLLATFSYGLYYSVIVKTYALLAFLFTLTFAALSLDSAKPTKYVLPVLFSLCATLIRLSAIFFAVPIIIYSYYFAPRRKDKGLILLIIIALSLFFLRFYLADVDAAKWNLLAYHVSQWGDVTFSFKLNEIRQFRIPAILQVIGTYLVFTAVSISSFVIISIRKHFSQNYAGKGWFFSVMADIGGKIAVPAVMLFGLLAFALSHLAAGGWHIEYLVPSLIGLFPILAIVVAKVYDETHSYFSARILWRVMVISLLIAELIRGITVPIDIADGRLPVEEMREVATFIATVSEPTDRLLVLEALWLAVDSDRYTLPGFSMAQFSYVNMNSSQAQRFNEVNYDMVFDVIVTSKAEIVAFTDHDWQLLQTGGDIDILRNELTYRYKLILEQEDFGQGEDTLSIYKRY